MKRPYKALLFVLASELAGNVGTIFTISAIPTWYATLTKPWFTPPNWLFAPVWLILFALMGVAAYLVYERGMKNAEARIAIYAFCAQFGLNVLWSALFFGLRSPLLGMAGIIALWMAILATIVLFYRVSRRAAYLLVPYIAWVSIAAALNYSLMALY
jgi:tryptophan-rich sensory protein